MPVPTTDTVTPLRVSSVVRVFSARVRSGAMAVPLIVPVMDALPDRGDDGPTCDMEAFPPHAATSTLATTSTAMAVVGRTSCIAVLQDGSGGGQYWQRSYRSRRCGNGVDLFGI